MMLISKIYHIFTQIYLFHSNEFLIEVYGGVKHLGEFQVLEILFLIFSNGLYFQ